MDKDVFVQNVKKYCDLMGVKPTIACAESGAGKNLVSEVAKRGVAPSVERVQLLAQYLGCTVSDLLGERAVPESGTVSVDDAKLLRAYHQAPAPIREIVDTALRPYEA